MLQIRRSVTASMAILSMLVSVPAYACGCCGGGDKAKTQAELPNQSTPPKSGGCMGGMGGMTGGSGKPAMSCGGGGMASMEMAQKQSDEKMMGDMDHSKMEMDHSKMDMSEPSTETDANKQFVTSMVPHHQSAVDMSIKYLKTGSDPELIKLAQAIIAAQEKEIAILQAWKSKATK